MNAASQTLNLRAARLADAAALAAIHARCFSPAWDEAAMRGFIADPACLCLLACATEPVGLLIVRHAADEAELLTLAVLPQARRKGAATALLDRACADLAGRGAGTLFLEVDQSNAAATSLYAALGFTLVGNRRDYYGPGANALILRRPTRSPARRTE